MKSVTMTIHPRLNPVLPALSGFLPLYPVKQSSPVAEVEKIISDTRPSSILQQIAELGPRGGGGFGARLGRLGNLAAPMEGAAGIEDQP